MRYTHFFWDFDGTLYDSYPRIARATAKALRDGGVEVPADQVYPIVKKSLYTAYCVFAAPHGIAQEAFMAAYHAHSEEEGPESIRPYPGAREALEAVRQGGGRNYLYTHRGESAFRWLAYDGLEDVFFDKVTSLDGFPSKPAPDALLHLVRKHGLALSQCVMIGDRDIDLDAGKNAGMACALFDPQGYYPDYPTPWRFAAMDGLRRALCGEGNAEGGSTELR